MHHTRVVLPALALLLFMARPAPSFGQTSPPDAPVQNPNYGYVTANPLDQIPNRDDVIGYMEFLSAVLGIILASWVVLRVCGYFARPDPAKYIMNDPWVRERLAREEAAPEQSSQYPPE